MDLEPGILMSTTHTPYRPPIADRRGWLLRPVLFRPVGAEGGGQAGDELRVVVRADRHDRVVGGRAPGGRAPGGGVGPGPEAPGAGPGPRGRSADDEPG